MTSALWSGPSVWASGRDEVPVCCPQRPVWQGQQEGDVAPWAADCVSADGDMPTGRCEREAHPWHKRRLCS